MTTPAIPKIPFEFSIPKGYQIVSERGFIKLGDMQPSDDLKKWVLCEDCSIGWFSKGFPAIRRIKPKRK